MAKNNDHDLSLIHQLTADYPQFRFCLNAKRFSYRPAPSTKSTSKPTIFIGPPQPFFALQTLHELGHALCKHKDYTTHVRRLKIERKAWDVAKTLCQKYHVAWDDAYVESCLDTYRDWLHTKSKCKNCGLTRYQDSAGTYHCPRCETFLS